MKAVFRAFLRERFKERALAELRFFIWIFFWAVRCLFDRSKGTWPGRKRKREKGTGRFSRQKVSRKKNAGKEKPAQKSLFLAFPEAVFGLQAGGLKRECLGAGTKTPSRCHEYALLLPRERLLSVRTRRSHATDTAESSDRVRRTGKGSFPKLPEEKKKVF